MKNLLIIIIVALSIGITSCSTMKSGSSIAISKEQMLLDAYTLANIECEYKLAQLKLGDDRNDFKLQSQFNTVKQDITALSKIINKRYNETKGLRDELNNVVKGAKEDLTTCLQLQEYEIIRAEKNIEKSNDKENNSNNKK